MRSRLALAAAVRRIVSLALAALVGVPAAVAAQASRMPIVADNIVVQRDVIYGRPDGAAVLADIAYPKAGKELPAIISVHGGRWTSWYHPDWSRGVRIAKLVDAKGMKTEGQTLHKKNNSASSMPCGRRCQDQWSSVAQ